MKKPQTYVCRTLFKSTFVHKHKTQFIENYLNEKYKISVRRPSNKYKK